MAFWSAIVEPVASLISEFVTDKDERNRLASQLEQLVITAHTQEIEAQARIIVAEATGDSWIQRSWRPLLMMTAIAIIANNYLIVPYATVFGVPTVFLEPPNELWSLLNIGVGGYIVGRSGEKMMTAWKSTSESKI